MEELISVIVPVYNGEKYIRKCVESIMNNTYPHLEILLINDGSKDHSLEVCESIAKEFSTEEKRVKVFSKENGGIASARMYGLERITGKYLCFVDQDDIVYPYTYETLKRNMDDYQSDMCIGSINCIRGKKVQHVSTTVENKVIEREEIEDYILGFVKYQHHDISYLPTIWNCMYQKKIIDQYHITFKNFVSCDDDSIFNFDFLMHAQRVSFEKEFIYGWVQNIKSYSHNPKYIADFYRQNDSHYQYIVSQLKDTQLMKKKIDFQQFERYFHMENLIASTVNEAFPENKTAAKRSIAYLQKLFDDAKQLGCDFSDYPIKKVYREPYYLTDQCLKKGRVGLAFYMDRYLYHCLIMKMTYFLKMIYYKI
ncbi:MAG: glycosyltransferase [Clostridia bacterium]|nr:glycosyltransferase [Clostridia bacterium]